jgi:hypothetical protein
MPEEPPQPRPLLLSELLTQEKPDSDVVIKTIREYADGGLYIHEGVAGKLIGKARPELGPIELSLVYQFLMSAAGNEKLPDPVRRSYEINAYDVRKKMDEVDPIPNSFGNGHRQKNGNGKGPGHK